MLESNRYGFLGLKNSDIDISANTYDVVIKPLRQRNVNAEMGLNYFSLTMNFK